MAEDTLPVLMVVADQQDFYYQEYGDTRHSDTTDASLNQYTPPIYRCPSDPNTNDTTSGGRTIVFTGLEDGDDLETDTFSSGHSDDLFF
jgi:hypothetical protein